MSERSEDQEARSEQIGAAIRSMSATVQAPADLRERLASQPAPRRRRRRRITLGLASATGALAAVAVALVLTLGGGSSTSAPSLADAADAAMRAPALPAPRVDQRNPDLLLASGAGLRFPNWHNGPWPWRAVGARHETVGDREITTVTYGNPAGERIGYTIVDRPPLAPPSGATSSDEYGLEARVIRAGDRNIVTWRRDGRTCVLASRTVPPGKLMRLAAWHGSGRVS